MSEEEIIGNINWAIHINKMTKSINGDNTHISVNVLQGLLDLYNKEKEKNKKIEETVRKGMKNLWIDSCAEDAGKYSAYMSIRSILEE